VRLLTNISRQAILTQKEAEAQVMLDLQKMHEMDALYDAPALGEAVAER